MRTNEPQAIYLKDYQPSAYLIDNVELEFDLKANHTLVTANLEVRANEQPSDRSKDVTPLVLNGEAIELVSLSLNERPLKVGEDYELTDNTLTIKMPPRHFKLQVVTKLNPEQNTALEGLYLTNGRFCTQCEAHGFRRITYYLDRPDVMARFKTKLVADKQKYPVLLSNGNLIEIGDLPEDKHYAVWEDPHRKPAYLFALVAGDLECIEDSYTTTSGREVAIKFYVESKHKHLCEHAISALKKSMKWDEDTFGLEYDLDIYMVVAVSDFNMGAMENKGLNVFNAKYVLANAKTATDKDFLDIEHIIGHEYFHNWTGNRITLRDWFQLSLKEGLTVYREQRFAEDMGSYGVQRVSDANLIKTLQFAEDAGPMAHPIRPDSYIEMNNFYTVTVYNKGAEVIRMMATLLGKKGFHQGMDLYVARYDGQAITTDHFIKAMEDANNLSLKQFSLWYSQAGTPLVSASWSYEPQLRQYSLTLKQSCKETPKQKNKKPFHIPVKIALYGETGEQLDLHLKGVKEAKTCKETVLELTEAEQTFVFEQVATKPVPSILRDFSAPVKLHAELEDRDYAFLVKNDTDAYNRWDASQSLSVNTIKSLMHQFKEGVPLSFDSASIADVFTSLLQDNNCDNAAKAQVLTIPSEHYIAETLDTIEVEPLLSARAHYLKEIAESMSDRWLETYQQLNNPGVYSFDSKSVGDRALKNLALTYLCHLDSDHGVELAKAQLEHADNMTCESHALCLLAHENDKGSETLVKAFYDKWEDHALVVNKWLTAQALSRRDDALAIIEALTEHAAFDWKNPNKNYALLSAMSRQNMQCFHREDGKGYRFMRTCIEKIDGMNPQVAARAFNAFLQWRRYDAKRQALQEAEIKQLLALKGISKDLFELVTRALDKKN